MTFFVASGTVILFLHVFSDYTGGPFLNISWHPAPLFSSCMSFLTTQEGMTFFVASGTVILFLHVFSDYTGGMTFFVASGTVFLFLHVFSDYKGGDDISLHPAPLFSSCMSFLTTACAMDTRSCGLDTRNARWKSRPPV